MINQTTRIGHFRSRARLDLALEADQIRQLHRNSPVDHSQVLQESLKSRFFMKQKLQMNHIPVIKV